jgi:hypothetical protein
MSNNGRWSDQYHPKVTTISNIALNKISWYIIHIALSKFTDALYEYRLQGTESLADVLL